MAPVTSSAAARAAISSNADRRDQLIGCERVIRKRRG
jgi:hypothetical protein